MKIDRVQTKALGVEWLRSSNVSDYPQAVKFMEDRIYHIRCKKAVECVWLVEHTPLYTAGTSVKGEQTQRLSIPLYRSGRGGQYTYHGPGQRTVYVMLDLKKRNLGIREYVRSLEQWVITVLSLLNIKGERRSGRVGVWVDMGGGTEGKICAIGVRIRKWVSFHGLAININPQLQYFNNIVPCGIRDKNLQVTSLERLNINTTLETVDRYLIQTFSNIF